MNDQDPMIDILRKQIHQSAHGRITFEQYMALSLYHPDYGYYSRPVDKVGKDGDFYTSANIGTIMADMVARYISTRIRPKTNKPLTVIEWGAGTGRLARHVLDAIQLHDPCCYEQLEYIAVETSNFHKCSIEKNVRAHAAKVNLVSHFTSPREDRHYVHLANEFLDAMPVRRLTRHKQRLCEYWVVWDELRQWFRHQLVEVEEQLLLNYIQKHGIHVHEGQTIEINLKAMEWIRHTVSTFPEGSWILADYGGVTEELYGTHRMNGTLLCYYRHRAFTDPFYFPGRQDMTAYVDFSACAREAHQSAAISASLLTQKQFLLEAGILSELESHQDPDPFSPISKRNRSIRQLLLSDQMSERFQVLLLEKRKSDAELAATHKCLNIDSS